MKLTIDLWDQQNDKLFSEFKESMKQQAASLSNVDNTNSLQVLERSTAKVSSFNYKEKQLKE